MKWLILAFGILANASASLLIKVAVTPPRKPLSFSDPSAVLGNWPLLFGIALYGAAFLLYTLALSRLPLNVAHPLLTAGAVATVALASALIFREPFHWTTGAGVVMVIAGVALITAHTG